MNNPYLKPRKNSGNGVPRHTKSVKAYCELPCPMVRVKECFATDELERMISRYKDEHRRFDSYLENQFIDLIKESQFSFYREVYFNISRSSYFLDFFSPEDMVAVEIDGSQHRADRHRYKDLTRDKNFCFIGVSTIRLSKEDLQREDFLSYFGELYAKAKDVAASLRDKEEYHKVSASLMARRKKYKTR